MKKLEVNIETNEKEIMVGTVKWLKRELENIKFRFSNTTSQKPCIVADFFEEKEGKREKTHSGVVVYMSTADERNTGHCRYNGGVKAVYPSSNDLDHVTFFEYLSPAAYHLCDKLIDDLVLEFLKKLDEDKEDLTITVTTRPASND